eukprot:TRINITY_DN67306_c5_g1_i1.p1 TRINITY_DN67306_c5_g1~~TRINITY_DN67306_c5_g1_i1.p1  ORF type:complete len:595 (+),score=265.49 TRINITY_DN67306_c5_g1_i1:29-1813(+)
MGGGASKREHERLARQTEEERRRAERREKLRREKEEKELDPEVLELILGEREAEFEPLLVLRLSEETGLSLSFLRHLQASFHAIKPPRSKTLSLRDIQAFDPEVAANLLITRLFATPVDFESFVYMFVSLDPDSSSARSRARFLFRSLLAGEQTAESKFTNLNVLDFYDMNKEQDLNIDDIEQAFGAIRAHAIEARKNARPSRKQIRRERRRQRREERRRRRQEHPSQSASSSSSSSSGEDLSSASDDSAGSSLSSDDDDAGRGAVVNIEDVPPTELSLPAFVTFIKNNLPPGLTDIRPEWVEGVSVHSNLVSDFFAEFRATPDHVVLARVFEVYSITRHGSSALVESRKRPTHRAVQAAASGHANRQLVTASSLQVVDHMDVAALTGQGADEDEHKLGDASAAAGTSGAAASPSARVEMVTQHGVHSKSFPRVLLHCLLACMQADDGGLGADLAYARVDEEMEIDVLRLELEQLVGHDVVQHVLTDDVLHDMTAWAYEVIQRLRYGPAWVDTMHDDAQLPSDDVILELEEEPIPFVGLMSVHEFLTFFGMFPAQATFANDIAEAAIRRKARERERKRAARQDRRRRRRKRRNK